MHTRQIGTTSYNRRYGPTGQALKLASAPPRSDLLLVLKRLCQWNLKYQVCAYSYRSACLSTHHNSSELRNCWNLMSRGWTVNVALSATICTGKLSSTDILAATASRFGLGLLFFSSCSKPHAWKTQTTME